MKTANWAVDQTDNASAKRSALKTKLKNRLLASFKRYEPNPSRRTRRYIYIYIYTDSVATRTRGQYMNLGRSVNNIFGAKGAGNSSDNAEKQSSSAALASRMTRDFAFEKRYFEIA